MDAGSRADASRSHTGVVAPMMPRHIPAIEPDGGHASDGGEVDESGIFSLQGRLSRSARLRPGLCSGGLIAPPGASSVGAAGG